MGDAHKLLQDFLAGLGGKADPRFQRQQQIEESITRFSPDAIEAQEILDAISASVKRNYSHHDQLVDVEIYFKALRKALERMEP